MRLLFTCRPTSGHFLPLLPVAEAARQRGHEVAFATNEPIISQARALGFIAHAAGLTDRDSTAALDRTGVVFRDLPPADMRPFAFAAWFAGIEAPARLADLDRICAAFRPDVLVHDVAELAAPLAATSAGVPWVTVGFGPLLQPAVAARAGEAMASLWQARGLAVPSWGGLYRHLYVDPCPPALQIAEIEDLPARIGIRPAAAGDDVVAKDRPAARSVYVSFGTLWNSGPAAVDLMRLTVAGSADAATEVVVTLGRDNDPALLGPQPDHVHVHRFIPQNQVLRACACMVAHGGAGTVLGALAWRVPLLLMPQFADQFYNADQAARAGAAITLRPAEARRDVIAGCVRRLLDEPTFRQRATDVRTELSAMPHVDAVVDRIHAVAGAIVRAT